MVVCSITRCDENQREEFNNSKTCLFLLPDELILINGKRIEKKLTRFEAETQNNKRIAGIKAIKQGCDTEKSSVRVRVAACLNYDLTGKLLRDGIAQKATGKISETTQ